MMVCLDRVSVSYRPGRPALETVSLDIAPGRFTVLLGPSGAGKSTLLRTLNGLVMPGAGRVLDAEGLSIFRSRLALKLHRRRTAMIFQQHHLVGQASALANACHGRLPHLPRRYAVLPLPRADRLDGLEALARVGLEDRAFEPAGRLSGGEQQRVGIARALMQRPEMLLADEPVASLDPATAAQIMDLLKTVAREDGLTAVVSLHQVDLARRYADTIVGLNQGRVVFEAAPDRLDERQLARIYQAPPSVSGAAPADPVEAPAAACGASAPMQPPSLAKNA